MDINAMFGKGKNLAVATELAERAYGLRDVIVYLNYLADA